MYLWPISPHHVGTFVPLGQRQGTGCQKCQGDQRDHVEITGQIPLTLALVECYLAGILPDLNEDRVIKYLTKNLHWNILRRYTDPFQIYAASSRLSPACSQ